jgi:hypothetical protein
MKALDFRLFAVGSSGTMKTADGSSIIISSDIAVRSAFESSCGELTVDLRIPRIQDSGREARTKRSEKSSADAMICGLLIALDHRVFANGISKY